MARPTSILLALLAFGLGAPSVGRASVKTLDDLSSTQILALQDSERRLITYDFALQELQKARNSRKITDQQFRYQDQELTGFISEEAEFQNAILIKERKPPIDVGELLENFARYAILVPAYIVAIAVKCFVSSGANYSFSP